MESMLFGRDRIQSD